MFKKISLLVFLSVPLIILADGHGKKEGKSPQEMKRMEMMKKKEAHMKKEMDSGHYCYVVYPLIEESDKMDLKDAKSGFESLQKVFKNYKI